MAAVPAIAAGLIVVGAMGLAGAPVTVMSTVVPALVMIFGYADGMHLCFAWRRHREAGKDVVEAERLAQQRTRRRLLAVRHHHFGRLSVAGDLLGDHRARLRPRRRLRHRRRHVPGARGPWPDHPRHRPLLEDRPEPAPQLPHLAGGALRRDRPLRGAPCADRLPARPIVLFVAFGAAHYSVPPEHSISEDLPRDNPANAALGRIDADFGGIYPLQIIVPLHGAAPTSAEGLARIRAVHEAVAGVAGIRTPPLSLWSLASWLGGGGAAVTPERLNQMLDALSPATRARFVGGDDAATVTATVREMPSAETDALVSAVEQAAQRAGGPDVTVTGVTVVNAREGARTISTLNLSLLLSVLANLGVIGLAFRSLPIGVVSFLPNMLPILATGTILFLTGRGMQFTTVIALTVAFGIAANDTVHFLNRFLHVDGDRQSLADRLIETSAHIGPVLVGTTLIIIAGMSTTLTSGMPTIAWFGIIASLTLLVGIVGDLVILPALIAGPGRRWFGPRPAAGETREEIA